MTSPISRDPFPWAEGEAYRTPKPEPELHPVCVKCNCRHNGPVGWCSNPNTEEKTDG